MQKIKVSLLFYLFFISFVFSAPLDSRIISNQTYVTGEDGVIRMYVNIIGHVKYPGSYLIYDGADLITALSIAGGYLDGADIKNIEIIKINESKEVVSLIKSMNQNESFVLKPRDTIFVKQKALSKIFTSSNIPGLLLSFLNVLVTLDRNK